MALQNTYLINLILYDKNFDSGRKKTMLLLNNNIFKILLKKKIGNNTDKNTLILKLLFKHYNY